MESHVNSAKLRRLGGSTVVTIPPALLKAVGLTSTAEVTINVTGNKLVIERKCKPRYTLDELMAQCDLTSRTRQSKAERAFMDAPRFGKEEI